MPRKSTEPHPSVARLLRALGENIRLARLRRGFSMAIVAERAGMSVPTLRSIERGEPGVTIGAYANALHSLGLHGDLAPIARDDELGRKLQDAKLPARRRAKKRVKSRNRNSVSADNASVTPATSASSATSVTSVTSRTNGPEAEPGACDP